MAIVDLDGAPARAAGAPVPQVVRRELAFQPARLPIQVGAKVEPPNPDDTSHHVFSAGLRAYDHAFATRFTVKF